MYGAIDRRRRPATNRALAPPSKRLATAAAAAAAFVAGACIVARRPGAQAPPPALLGARASSPSPSSPASSSDDAATSSTASPHVLLLYADDMGWADVGWNNADVANVTVHLDRLAASGVRLHWYYGQPSCTPSRAAVLTGRYPIHTGMQFGDLAADGPYGLPLEYTTIGDEMRASGYATYFLGKWNVGLVTPRHLAGARGFDYFLEYHDVMQYYYDHKLCSAINGTDWYDLLQGDGAGWALPTRVIGDGLYSTLLYANLTASILAKHGDDRDDDAVARADDDLGAAPSSSPAYVHVAFQAPHGPSWGANAPPSGYFSDALAAQIEAAAGGVADREAALKVIYMVDLAVGQIDAALADSGLRNKSVVVFASDNGGCPTQSGTMNYPLRGAKLSLFEGGVRLPAFVYAPGYMAAARRGETYRGLMHATDWLPTLLEAAGASAPSGLDGVSQYEQIVLGTGGASPRTELLHNINIWTTDGARLEELSYTYAALRSGDWKLITREVDAGWYTLANADDDDDGWGAYSCMSTSGGSYDYLFNVTGDPYETDNLYDERSDVVSALEAKLEAYAAAMRTTVWAASATSAAVAAWASLGEGAYVTPWENVSGYSYGYE